eukprot:TRINITY_DN24180_c0_g1_i5.p1 TRINITY_DN24180_c0_g1~~TRINITY_DN24180_c0_g1_i5.p1  ORF type:complete len:490 (-),score=79.85 TRINITY_DN24180_c0_g1_i5:574-2043(-)
MDIDSESVQEFSKITGANSDQALFFLEASGGDIHNALNMWKEQNMVMQHQQTNGVSNSIPSDQEVAQPRSLSNRHRFGFVLRVLKFPVNVISGTFGLFGAAFTVGFGIFVTLFGRWIIPYALLRRWFGLRFLATQNEQEQLQQRPHRSDLSPQQEAEVFLCEFERNYGSISPHFELSSWHQATITAHQAGQMTLAILLHASASPDDRKFCQQTLARQEIVTFVNENFKCWGGLIGGDSNGDSHALMQRVGSLGINGFRRNWQQWQQVKSPVCLLLAFSGSSLQVVSSQHGCVTPQQFMEWLMKAQEVFQPRLQMEQMHRQEQEFSRLLREEQDAAYVESLRLDQQKEEEKERQIQRKKEEELLKIQEEERLRQEEEEKIKQQNELEESKQRRRMQKQSQLPLEPSKEEPGSTVRIKLPDGTTTHRRFYEHDKVGVIFDYVESLDNLTCWNFKLVTQYPQRQFTSDDFELTLKEADLCPSAVLYVSPQDD